MKFILKKTFLPAYFACAALLIFSACGDDDGIPEEENAEEIITDIKLTFSPDNGSGDVVVLAIDPDGEGVQDFTPQSPIRLKAQTNYILSVEISNEIENEDITAEVREEADEHMLFYEFTNNAFISPTGNGNIDERTSDAVDYLDADNNDLPLGLRTNWTTGDALESGSFRVVLKHQPGIKTATSTSEDGESDFNVPFVLEIEE